MIMQIGSINLMLLQALKDSSKYGLEIVKYVSDATNGVMDVKQPSLYSGLNRLEKRGLISSYWKDSEIGGRRHYYTITELGLTQLKLHSTQIQSIMSGIIPEDEEDDEDDLESNESDENSNETSTEILEEIFLDNSDNADSIDSNDITETEEDIQDNRTETIQSLSQNEQDNSPIDIESLLNIKVEESTPDEPIAQNTKKTPDSPIAFNNNYGEYKPKSHSTNKSFSQKMRSYVEPNNNYKEFELPKTTEIVDTTTITNFNTSTNMNAERINPQTNFPPRNPQIPTDKETYITNRETTVEYTHQEKNDIDYKNILGELDAELNHSTPQPKLSENIEITEPLQKQQPVNNSQPKKSAYSATLANILTTAKNINITPTQHSKNINVGNQQRLEELNRKYDGCAELKCNTDLGERNIQPTQVTKKIESKKSGYSHIAQDDITIKPYVKQDKKVQSDKNYLFINKFNLIRTFIMFVIMCIELGGMYWYFTDSGLLDNNTTATTIFIISAVIICMYVGLMLTFSVPNLQKIVLRSNISWKSDFFYRLLLTIIMMAFVIALNVFLGMSNFMDPEYLMQWVIPSVMIFNITLSGIVGYILNLFKVQCK